MKTFLHALKFIAILIIAITLYACPVFKSIKYPKTVYLGDTVTVHVTIDLMETENFNDALLEVFLPEGWQLIDSVIELNGLHNPERSLRHHSWDADGYWSVSVSDEVESTNVLFDLEMRNTKSTLAVDTFRIGFIGEDMFYQREKECTIHTINDDNVPTQFTYNDGMLEWKAPKNNANTKGYFVSDNSDSWFTADNKANVDAGTQLHRYSVSAVANDDTEHALNDTIFIFHGDTLFVSATGNYMNEGTEINPLQSLKMALNIIDEEYLLNKDKCIRLLDGNYFLNDSVELRDRISLIGNGPQNSIIVCTNTGTGISSMDINTGFTIADLSILSQQNHTILDLSTVFPAEPRLILSNVQLYNTGSASVGLRSISTNLLLDHFLVAGMDSIGIISSGSQITNSVIVENNIGLFPISNLLVPGSGQIVNSIFFDNQTAITESPSYLTINNTIIDEQWTSYGEGNFYADPLFIDDENYPYLLDPSSPAVDAAVDSAKYDDHSDNGTQMALFPARGTVRGDLGIYGGGWTAPFSGIVSHRIYHDLDFYPNPVKDVLTIHWPNSKTPDRMWLSNVNGMRLMLLYQNNQIDLSAYAPGLYLFFAEIDGKYYRSKIIKN
ncbi:T9SS type A sorting domain-containing protein [uncultured Draconibacterium sp.]|uniref:T9SS type A sorting domain-containing protein n=1 Tax=uncultured Draconibacterium sp. TaxID=1573823 RepID=UPI0025E4E9CA|nr:T9SS type A sorting domain-containing protein [uncultured Draconibacterium sp.]